jgi:hypothetical protein
MHIGINICSIENISVSSSAYVCGIYLACATQKTFIFPAVCLCMDLRMSEFI